MYTNEEYDNYEKPHKNNKKLPVIIGIFAISICIVILIIFFINKIKDSKIVFTLTGQDVSLKINEKYIEPGFVCYSDTSNYEKQVEVTDNIVYKKPGVYTITYKCKNKILTRKVTVLEPTNYELTIDLENDKTGYTNSDVSIKYTITGESFLEILLPNGMKSDEYTGNITISKNGSYQVKAYNIRNEEFVKEIEITNIDKEKPDGKCEAIIKNKNTEITVNATDNVQVVKYEYYDNNKLLNTNNSNTFTTESTTSKNIMVKVFDEAGNFGEINCNVTEKKYIDPIKPITTDNVIFQIETDTLKAYIIKKNSYYITRIWVLDAYSQFNKAVSPKYGVKLYKPVELVKQAMISNGLQNNAIIGFNTSGFYLRDTYDASSVNKYSAYDKTAVGTIVINNGVVFRNAYNKAFKQWYIMGINKDNKMLIFEDNVASTDQEIASKQTWAQTVINSGIRNTHSFAGPVILNGQKLSVFSKSMPDSTNKTPKGLQLICQINENNFALFTAKNEKRNTAINEFLAMGCQTATNLDGGGSVALFYKEKNSQEFKSILGGGRELPEAGYFTE